MRAKGRCHCGTVRLTVPRAPTMVTECHCSICRRYAPLWAYYRVDEVSYIGPTEAYEWGRKSIVFRRCIICGCVMGWMPSGAYPECGVNARMLDGFDKDTVTVTVEGDASV